MQIRITFLLILLSISKLVVGQESAEKINTKTPYQTLSAHFEYLSDEYYNPELAASVINPARHAHEEAISLAKKLMHIYKGEGISIEFEEVPNDPNYYDSLHEKHRYYVTSKFPNIFLEKVGNNWYYAEKTIENVDPLFKQVYPFGAHRLLNLLPKIGGNKVFGLKIWQLVSILALIMFCVLIHKIFTFFIQQIIIKILLRQGYDAVVKKLVGPIARPISILIIYPILMLLVPVVQLDVKVNYYIMLVLKATWPLFATAIFYKIVDVIALYFKKLAERTESTLDDQMVPIIRKTLKIFVLIIGGLAILNNLNVDIIPLLTGLSIGGLAFALAAQDTLKNFFGSVMIFIDRPFQIGDWITSGDIDGTVEEVGFRATRIRTFRNSVTYVPNARIVDSMVDNHGLRKFRRFYTQIALTYDTPPEVIEVFVNGLRKIVEKHPATKKDNYHVYLNDMAASSLNVMFYIFFDVPDWAAELKAKHEILLEIIKLAEAMGVNFAFPTQTLHMETFPEKIANSPTYVRNSNTLKEMLGGFLGGKK
jgi:MscS family membrane protein